MKTLSNHSLSSLLALRQNRHALSQLSTSQYHALFNEVLGLFNDIHPLTGDNTWYLLGTDGCHLCDLAFNTLSQAGAVRQLPRITRLDITDSGDDTLIDALGWHIPILFTPNQALLYPFSLMDILAID